MYFNVKGTGIAEGHCLVNVTKLKNDHKFNYDYKIKIGKYIKIPFVGKKFIGHEKKGNNYYKISKHLLNINYLYNKKTFYIDGMEFKRENKTKFKFKKSSIKGEIILEKEIDNYLNINNVKHIYVYCWGLKVELHK